MENADEMMENHFLEEEKYFPANSTRYPPAEDRNEDLIAEKFADDTHSLVLNDASSENLISSLALQDKRLSELLNPKYEKVTIEGLEFALPASESFLQILVESEEQMHSKFSFNFLRFDSLASETEENTSLLGSSHSIPSSEVNEESFMNKKQDIIDATHTLLDIQKIDRSSERSLPFGETLTFSDSYSDAGSKQQQHQDSEESKAFPDPQFMECFIEVYLKESDEGSSYTCDLQSYFPISQCYDLPHAITFPNLSNQDSSTELELNETSCILQDDSFTPYEGEAYQKDLDEEYSLSANTTNQLEKIFGSISKEKMEKTESTSMHLKVIYE
ncbi:uncharacterized protein MONOS_8083 [Monocercomonoides exilis]|uniref:uncharacterized protein n=1 Tax=Monocercomonoides exilis TaxID=2049356 RepID=UPI0035595BF1|nr:hypothetical protein MONOS_8083 [Monocercomonoides exilis]|eukprot:MONOS_8083.1-p1 / transcript=MONOS_8083.1 / gene=MONOS_8083 / organism=Monocercomonoides_exilis_PA203 / gene_product=unspecified product / transcript_product=unspecified product / location=Mono_scaffold00295:37330-38631(-) / protein_length=331 / sequence_SO=supercontig / SO=protein_coding / is_pseudo=false